MPCSVQHVPEVVLVGGHVPVAVPDEPGQRPCRDSDAAELGVPPVSKQQQPFRKCSRKHAI